MGSEVYFHRLPPLIQNTKYLHGFTYEFIYVGTFYDMKIQFALGTKKSTWCVRVDYDNSQEKI